VRREGSIKGYWRGGEAREATNHFESVGGKRGRGLEFMKGRIDSSNADYFQAEK